MASTSGKVLSEVLNAVLKAKDYVKQKQ